ncbi:MAG: hypothetical protein Q4D98_01845 [Planctomycetia bacterium]|nr:hypothetical protein [Planctomycetia bacterium]
MSKILFCSVFIAFCVGASGAETSQGGPGSEIPGAKRFAIIFDTTTPPANQQNEYETAIQTLADCLKASGIPEKNIHVYSSFSTPATRKKMQSALRRKSWKSNPPEELQVYITANGLSNGTKDMLVPSGVSVEDVQETGDSRLIAFEEIQKMIANSGATRILLVMNFQSVKAVTRSSGAGSKLQNVRIQGYRGLRSNEYFDDEESETENAEDNPKKNFQFLQIVTRDQDIRGTRISDFYQTFRGAMEGYADISGNNDGKIQAEELAHYLRDNTEMTVEISRNGNAEYLLCEAKKKAQIPAEIFESLQRTFTREEFRQERDSAAQRATVIRNAKGGNP